MKQKAILLSLCFFTVTVNLISQVRLQTGSAEYSIPIFNYADNNTRLGTFISLNYTSGNGLKVSDVASNVGTGWSLEAGGFIQRYQVGEPDDQNSLSIFPKAPNNCNVFGWSEAVALAAAESSEPGSINYVENYFPNGFLYTEFTVGEDYLPNTIHPSNCNVPRELVLSPRFKPSMDKRWKQSRRALADREQDVFIFSFNGRSGQFVIGKDGTVLVMPDSKLKVTYVDGGNLYGANIRTRITGFTITDESGIQYVFNEYETSEVSTVETTSQSNDLLTTESQATGKYVITKWNLSQIVNKETSQFIRFNYDVETVSLKNNYNSSYSKVEISGNNNNGTVVLNHDLSQANIKRLNSIDFPDGKTLVRFLYYPDSRYDLIGDLPLKEIEISNNGEPLKKCLFDVGYFVKKQLKELNDISTEEEGSARLALKSFQISSKTGSKIPPYLFDYYTGDDNSDEKSIVPPQFTFAQDMWGYYNKSKDIREDELIPSEETLRNLHINKREISESAAAFGLLKSIRLPEGGKLTYEYGQNKYDKGGGDIFVGGVRVEKTTITDDFSSENSIVTQFQYIKDGERDLSSLWGYEAPENIVTRQVRSYIDAPLFNYSESGNNVANFVSSLTRTIAKKIVTIGPKGLSVKPMSAAVAQTAFQLFITQIILPAVITLFHPYDDYQMNEYSFYPVWYQNPIPFQYSRVVTKVLDSKSGSVINEFRAPSDQTLEIPPLTFPFSSKQRFASWEYGLPLVITYLNEHGNPVKKIVNKYNNDGFRKVNENAAYRSVKIEPNRIYNARCEYFTYTVPVTEFSYDFYYPISGRAELINTQEFLFGNDGNKITNSTDFEYNLNNYLVSKASTRTSEGKIKESRIYYPEDYKWEQIPKLQTMVMRNMVNFPVSTETWQIDNTGKRSMLGSTVTEFDVVGNGDCKPVKNYSFFSTKPEPETGIIGVFNPNFLVRNSTLIKPVNQINYDQNGDPSETINILEDRNNCTVFDIVNHLPVATVINAKRDEVAYTSFEAGEYSYWAALQGEIINGSGITGGHCVEGDFIVQTPSVNINKEYKLSFWYSGTNFHGVGASPGTLSPATVGPSVNGWTYYEYNLPAGFTSPFSIAGLGRIDEIRLYPAKARMSTATYLPGVGKTSDCDENNHIRYYEYDGLGRLKIVKNEKGDVIKTYEYHYKYN